MANNSVKPWFYFFLLGPIVIELIEAGSWYVPPAALPGVVATTVLIGLLVGIDQRRQRQLIAFSERDAVTGIPNRKAFMGELEKKVRNARRDGDLMALSILDIDGFKAINDTCGHYTGDAVLGAIGVRLRKWTAVTGDQCFRIGGDEFAIISRSSPFARRNSFRADVENGIRREIHQQPPWDVSVSCGTAVLKPDEDETSLFCRADVRMYFQKRKRAVSLDTGGTARPNCSASTKSNKVKSKGEDQ